MLWSKFIPYTPVQPWGVIGAPLPCNFKNKNLGSVPSIYTEVLALTEENTNSNLTNQGIKFLLYFQILQSNVIDDTDDEADDYFSDMDGTSSINNAPSGLMSLLGKTN